MKPIKSKTVRNVALVPAIALGAFSVSELGVAQSDDADRVPLKTSINALMVALVDHAAHEIWEAGSAERLTGRDWQTVEQHAFQLVASGALISLEGTGPQDKVWVATPEWQDWAKKLTDGGLAVLDAVQKSDQRALHTAGQAIVDTCFGCHDMFKPDAPTEGLLHVPHYED
jgi:cytochrome c556